jgi:hypothetical protein
VDGGGGVPVTVRLTIPSAKAAEFTVHVTFACTVTDPVRVVRENLDAERALLSYLKSHQKIFHLGLDYDMLQITEVRIAVDAQITAYTTIRPPVIPGLEVSMTSVEVLTPTEVAEFEHSMRKQRYELEMARRKQENDHLLLSDREHNDQELDEQRRRYRYRTGHDDRSHGHLIARMDQEHDYELVMARERQDEELSERRLDRRHAAEREERAHERFLAVTGQQHEHRIRAEADTFALDRLDKAQDAIGDDPVKALLYAHAQGELTATEVADRLHANAREDQQWLRQETRETQRHRLEANLDVLRELAKRGHLDVVNLNVERLLAEVAGVPQQELAAGAADRPALDAPAERPEAVETDAISADGPGADHGEPNGNEFAAREEDDV